MIPEDVARIAHAANRELQRIQADPGIAVSPSWDDDTDETRESVRAGVLGIRSGLTAKESHESWCEFKRSGGWVHGPVKDPVAKTHPCLVPYDELPPAQQLKDQLFAAIVRALSQDDYRYSPIDE